MLKHHLKFARYFFIFSVILIFALLGSCDRFENKWERRERKLHYLNEEIDSARKLETHTQDSMWHVLDSIKDHQK